MPSKYILISTDGYSLDDYTIYDTFSEAQTAMQKAYNSLVPKEWCEGFEELSYCEWSDAILYNNGEDVYVWKIICID